MGCVREVAGGGEVSTAAQPVGVVGEVGEASGTARRRQDAEVTPDGRGVEGVTGGWEGSRIRRKGPTGQRIRARAPRSVAQRRPRDSAWILADQFITLVCKLAW